MDLRSKPSGSGPTGALNPKSSTMGPPRRTKKRPSYGMRTVELIRGHSGFGFTLSGQGPCILSNIVADSPASRAMLRSGDHVIAVNGQNVSKSGHDEVVKLIGNSTGVLKLQIAESYCSNSSSEDETQVSRKFERAIGHHHHHPVGPAPQQQQQPLPQHHRVEALPAATRVYLSDDEEYMLSPAALLPPPPLPRPLHMRGNSADSTLTESSMLNAYQRPKRPSPRKRAVKPTKSPKNVASSVVVPTSKSTTNLRRVELHGSDELQLSEQVRDVSKRKALIKFERYLKE